MDELFLNILREPIFTDEEISVKIYPIKVFGDSPFFFSLTLDDLPVRGFIGHLEESGFLPHKHKVRLWTHLNFHLEYNKDKVCRIFFYFILNSLM